VIPRIGTKQLTNLTALDLQGLYSDLANAGRSARSIHHTHLVLHRAFGQAVKWNLLARNPCDGATASRPQRAEMKVLTPEQVRAFLGAAVVHPAHTLYTLAITSGMRARELLGLQWSDVDLGFRDPQNHQVPPSDPALPARH
jgi:integrase